MLFRGRATFLVVKGGKKKMGVDTGRSAQLVTDKIEFLPNSFYAVHKVYNKVIS